MDFKIDKYTMKARFAPMMIVIFPIIMFISIFVPIENSWIKSISTILFTLVLIPLFSELGRSKGKKKEELLFVEWGGKPTTQLLSHKNNDFSQISFNRYRKQIELIVGNKLPTKEKEDKNWEECEEIYNDIISYLKERTRNKEIFSLLISENTSYGFRRNLLALKVIGIVLLLLIFFTILIYVYYTRKYSIYIILNLIFDVFFLLFWIFIVTKRWVKKMAFEYAKRLICSVDILYEDYKLNYNK